MASTDSGIETGYESNDSSMTVESPKSDFEASGSNEMQASSDIHVIQPEMPPFSFGNSNISLEHLTRPCYSIHNIPCEPTVCFHSTEDRPTYVCFKKYQPKMCRKHAVRWQHVRSLIPRLKDILGERKLRVAASTNNYEAVEMLLNGGVDPKCSDQRKRTALHIAACKGYAEIAQLLLKRGADPNQKDLIGNTPLHLAACTNHVNVVTLLLKAGTDVRSIDNAGRTALHLAQSKLTLLQMDNSYSSQQLKAEVCQVIEMMQAYLKHAGQDAEAELMVAFSSRLHLTNTKEEVDHNVRDLLTSLSQLSLRRNET